MERIMDLTERILIGVVLGGFASLVVLIPMLMMRGI
jgi:hypothetical protein